MINNQLKRKLWQQGYELLEQKIAGLRQEVKELNEAMESESKSSAGDKHETGRAMMHLDLERTGKQLADAEESMAMLQRINPDKSYNSGGIGSLMETSAGIYFVSIPLGKVTVEQTDVFFISVLSPIGQLLNDKKAGESISLNGRQITIQHVL